jgi:hypothetical protein
MGVFAISTAPVTARLSFEELIDADATRQQLPEDNEEQAYQ